MLFVERLELLDRVLLLVTSQIAFDDSRSSIYSGGQVSLTRHDLSESLNVVLDNIWSTLVNGTFLRLGYPGTRLISHQIPLVRLVMTRSDLIVCVHQEALFGFGFLLFFKSFFQELLLLLSHHVGRDTVCRCKW